MTGIQRSETRKVLHMRHLFALLFGTIVGVGWIAATGSWIENAGPIGAIVAFSGGAAVMTLIGLCYAELMAMLPEASGAVGYAQRVFGTRAAYATGWLLILSYAATLAFFIVTIPWLLQAVAPGYEGPTLYQAFGNPVTAGPVLIAALIAVAIAWVNQRGGADAAGLQSVIVAIKICLMIVLVAAALLRGSVGNLSPMFEPGPAGPCHAVLAVMVTTPFWFAGFDVLPQAMRERQSGFDLSRLGWLVVVTTAAALAFYALIIVAATMLLPRSDLIRASLPTYEAFHAGLGSPLLARLVILLGVIGLLSAWNATVFAGARIMQAMGEARLLPAWLGALTVRDRTPARCIWLLTAIGFLLGLGGSSAVGSMIEAASITLVGSFAILSAGVVRMRRTQPALPRPYAAGPGWMPVLAVVASLALLAYSVLDPWHAGSGVPVAWWVTACWCAVGATWWIFGAGTRNELDASERDRILAGAG